jgi:hypothetical protein
MLRLLAPRPRLARSTRGSVAVEAALILPIFFLLAFGAIELGRYWWTQNTIERAAAKAVRYAVVRGSGWSTLCADVTAARCQASGELVGAEAERHLALLPPGLRPAGVTVTPAGWIGGAGSQVVVNIEGTFEFILWPGPDVPLSSTAEMVVLR